MNQYRHQWKLSNRKSLDQTIDQILSQGGKIVAIVPISYEVWIYHNVLANATIVYECNDRLMNL